MHEIAPRAEGGDGGEVGRASVHEAAAEDADPPALALVQVVGKLWHHRLHLLLHALGSGLGAQVLGAGLGARALPGGRGVAGGRRRRRRVVRLLLAVVLVVVVRRGGGAHGRPGRGGGGRRRRRGPVRGAPHGGGGGGRGGHRRSLLLLAWTLVRLRRRRGGHGEDGRGHAQEVPVQQRVGAAVKGVAGEGGGRGRQECWHRKDTTCADEQQKRQKNKIVQFQFPNILGECAQGKRRFLFFPSYSSSTFRSRVSFPLVASPAGEGRLSIFSCHSFSSDKTATVGMQFSSSSSVEGEEENRRPRLAFALEGGGQTTLSGRPPKKLGTQSITFWMTAAAAGPRGVSTNNIKKLEL